MVSQSPNEGLASRKVLCDGRNRRNLAEEVSLLALLVKAYTYMSFERSVVHAHGGGRSNDDASHSKRENAGDELHI
jgi:hypothetical protein